VEETKINDDVVVEIYLGSETGKKMRPVRISQLRSTGDDSPSEL
jgi:hypothetical protein